MGQQYMMFPLVRVQSLSELTVQERFKYRYSGIGYHL